MAGSEYGSAENRRGVGRDQAAGIGRAGPAAHDHLYAFGGPSAPGPCRADDACVSKLSGGLNARPECCLRRNPCSRWASAVSAAVRPDVSIAPTKAIPEA